MSIYKYKPSGKNCCDYCRNGFEIQQDMKDKPLTKCPKCGSRVERIISSFSIVKGYILSHSNLKEHGFTRLKKLMRGNI